MIGAKIATTTLYLRKKIHKLCEDKNESSRL